jgi:hypothetical protein
MIDTLLNLIIILAVLIVAWFIIVRFSPDELITKICQVIIFIIALVVIVRTLLPLAGV